MSKIVTTALGRFRMVEDHGQRSFLFECPECHEWLPLSEDHLSGSVAPIHFARTDDMGTMTHGRVCHFSEKQPYGANLIATMQARLLMAAEGEDVKPYDTDHESLYLGGLR